MASLKDSSLPWLNRFRLGSLILSAMWLSACLTSLNGAEKDKRVTAEEVRALVKLYAEERQAAEASGVAKKFSPEIYARADGLAAKAQKAMEDPTRLQEAFDEIKKARWALPSLPTDLPEQVVRIFGDPKLRHNAPVRALAFTNDGKFLISAAEDGILKVWDAKTGREIRTYKGHADKVNALAISSDNKTVASAGSELDIHLWDLTTGKDIKTLKGQKSFILALTFSPDGQSLASGGDSKEVLIHGVASAKVTQTLVGHAGRINGLAYSPDGLWLISVGGSDRNHTARLWDVKANYRNNRSMQTHGNNKINCVAFAPDNKSFASGGDDHHARMLDPGNFTEKQKFEGHSGNINAIAYSKDGRSLITGGDDHAIRLWDIQNGQTYRTFLGHTGDVLALAVSPDGTTLASAGSDEVIRFWDMGNAEQSRDLSGHSDFVWSASFSPDGVSLVSASKDRTARIWNVAQGHEEKTLSGHHAPVTAALYSPDSSRILTAGGDRLLKLWDAKTGQEIRTYKGHQGPVTAIAFSSDGKFFVSGSADKSVRVWNVDQDKEIKAFYGHESVVSAVAFGPGDKVVASAGGDGQLYLWEVSTLKVTKSIQAHAGAVSALAYSPSFKLIATCGADNQVKVRDANLEGIPVTLQTHAGPITSIAFSPNNKYIASGGADLIVKIWDVTSKQEVNAFRGHKDWVTSVAFNSKGTALASASVDKTIKIWELVGKDAPVATGPGGEILAVAASSNGQWLAQGSADGSVRVFEAESGKERFTYAGLHSARITALVFTPDNKTLVTVGYDHRMNVCDLQTGKTQVIEKGPGSEVPAIAALAGGKAVVVWTRNQLEIYDIVNLKQTDTQTLPSNDIGALYLTPDGSLAAFASKNSGTVQLWDVIGKKPVAKGEFPAHQEALHDLMVSPDRSMLVTTDKKGNVRIWDIAKVAAAIGVKQPEPVKTIPAFKKVAAAMAMAADGKSFAIAGTDNVIKVWKTDSGDETGKFDFHIGRPGFFRALAFSGNGKELATANYNSTCFVLDVKGVK